MGKQNKSQVQVTHSAPVEVVESPVEVLEVPVEVESPVEAIVEAPVTKPSASKSDEFPGLLRMGHSGEKVVILQNALMRKGLLSDVNGVFDAVTSGAVRRAEDAIGEVNLNGILTPKIWASLV